MENESIWDDDRHSDCVRTCQAGWRCDYSDKGFVSELVFWSQGLSVFTATIQEFDEVAFIQGGFNNFVSFVFSTL